MPIVRQLDEIGGAVFGLVYVALVLAFHLVVLDSFFEAGGQVGGWLGGWYDAMNDALIGQFLRDVVIPTAGFLARPFVPAADVGVFISRRDCAGVRSW